MADASPIASTTKIIQIKVRSLPVSPPRNENEVYDASCFPDVALFRKTAQHPAIIVCVQSTATVMRTIKRYVAKGIKNVLPAGEDHRKVVLKVDTTSDQVRELLKSSSIEWSTHTAIREYKDQAVSELLRQLLPSIHNPPTAFEQVGHIAHLNLPPSLLPYQYWIGRVVLDCNFPRIRTVVNKSGMIHNTFRTFPMTIVAGEHSTLCTSVRENGATYQFDFAKVYWNSRLSQEHGRVVQDIRKRRRCKPLVVADWTAGVGPFAIPLACTGDRDDSAILVVHANDLNPASFRYLQENRKLNAMAQRPGRLHEYNMDARDFCRHLYDTLDLQFDVAILNLPAIAAEMLDVLSEYSWPVEQVYVYGFDYKADDQAPNLQERCQTALGRRQMLDVHVHNVRDVSPLQNMYCIAFRLSGSDKKIRTE